MNTIQTLLRAMQLVNFPRLLILGLGFNDLTKKVFQAKSRFRISATKKREASPKDNVCSCDKKIKKREERDEGVKREVLAELNG